MSNSAKETSQQWPMTTEARRICQNCGLPLAETETEEQCRELLGDTREIYQRGYQAGLEAAAPILKRSREFLIQWRELNPSPASQLGTDTDSFLGELAAAIRQLKE